MSSGESLFSGGRDLTGFTDAPRSLRALERAPALLRLLDEVAKVGWSRRGLGFTDEFGAPREDKRGRLMVDGRMAAVLENHIPVLEWLGRALDGPVWLAEQAGLAVEESLDRMQLGRDDYDGLDEFLRILSFYGGIAGVQVDPAEVRRRRLEEALRERRRARALRARRQRVIDNT